MLFPDIFATCDKSILTVLSSEVSLRASTSPNGDGRYVGLTFSSKRIYVARRDGRVDVYDKGFKLVGRIDRPRLDWLHGALYHNGVLNIVNTAHDEIARFQKGAGEYTLVPMIAEPEYSRKDTLHINMLTLDVYGGYWLTQTERTDGTGTPMVYKLDESMSISETREFGKGPHGVYRIGDFAFIPSSRENKLLKVRLSDWTIVKELTFETDWIRGVAATPDIIAVGITGYEPIRSDRTESASYIYYLDYDLNILGSVFLGYVGAIGEIRIINQPDIVHNEYVLQL
jgi:hypothetical protein